ncbi:adenylate kinase [Fructilactobacillus fructivorans]|uniref:Adenylate kinase n=1 Tax=Fructilactobacillus fructivorans TaxID=1614 RepID=A0A0C1LXD5_9LACO|nr:adenylate kinase [Fructilactobacillus fructivorans]KID41375.1 Adenylate kinase [Fructilactobacillus fructivorans]MCT0151738.1 adenylate kinase [Fructilactobacillus fructivorans]MCT2867134.1 adenylate kinase [Fructilactobacillus fructivorans]MCT2868306.1 adenylate kinase [Fructilactobacillus fructivorans]MCT2873014.1 adenylate kinase [Fructilactobacillus fructivorans]
MSMNLLLMGLPGAGKGTQAEFIVQKYGIPHISTGDIFRAAMKNKTPMGVKAQQYIDKGELVPDDVTCGIVEDRLKQPDTDKGYLLDGFPRNIDQAKSLEDMTRKMGKELDAVINIEVDPKVLVDRLSGRFICKNCGATYHKLYKKPIVDGTCDVCGAHVFYQRSDDKPETVKNRLKVNEKSNAPLIDFYKDRGILHSVDGDRDIADVSKDIDKILSNLN